ncbi:MAG: ferredoxin [Chloroflexi bacterium]|jgi:electron transport complex protein RnfB|nr:ferredoxin [Chloroflexota bacterium]
MPDAPDRRRLLRTGLRVAAAAALGGLAGALTLRPRRAGTVWQIDPSACVQCERCSTHCVLDQSAVRCVHAFDLCGYCKLCGGYHRPEARVQDTAAEHQLCPTGALRRTFVEEPFYEYTVDEALCTGCGRCVKGCGAFGNGSLFLQVRHDRCLGCNRCAIAEACPAQAFRQVPAGAPYLLRGKPRST